MAVYCLCVCIYFSTNLEVVDKFCYLGDTFSVDGDADAAVEARIRIGWNKFRQLVPLLTNRDISLIRKGRLYSSGVRSSMLHGSETWPVRKENEVALQPTEMRMVRWMCNVKELVSWSLTSLFSTNMAISETKVMLRKRQSCK